MTMREKLEAQPVRRRQPAAKSGLATGRVYITVDLSLEHLERLAIPSGSFGNFGRNAMVGPSLRDSDSGVESTLRY